MFSLWCGRVLAPFIQDQAQRRYPWQSPGMEPVPKPQHPSSCPTVPHPAHLCWISFVQGYFGECWDSLVNAVKAISLFPSLSSGGTFCAPLCQAWRQQWFFFGWILAGLGAGDCLFLSCKYRFPFGLFCSSKENIDSSTGQAGLCTGSSTLALLLFN